MAQRAKLDDRRRINTNVKHRWAASSHQSALYAHRSSSTVIRRTDNSFGDYCAGAGATGVLAAGAAGAGVPPSSVAD